VVLGHEVDAAVERLEHPEAEKVEFDEPDGRAVVLVPLEHGAPGHPAPLDRAHLDHRPVAEHHARRVDPEVPGAVEHLGGELGHEGGQRLGAGGRGVADRFDSAPRWPRSTPAAQPSTSARG